MSRTPFYSLLWKGENPKGESPKINSQEVKDLGEGLASVKTVIENVTGLTDLIGGSKKVEKTSEVIGEVNQTIDQAAQLTDRLNPKPTSTGDQIKGIRETISEAKALNEELSPRGDEDNKGERRKFSVSPDGQIVLDPDGDFIFKEALQYAAQLRGGNAPAYYYQDPQSGDFKEAKGPTFIQASSPPQVWMVNQAGEVKQVQPGEPIVVKQSAPPPDTGPKVGGKSWVVKPDGEVVEHEPGKPIVITMPAQSPNLFHLVDKEGNPVQLTQEALNMQTGLWRTIDENRREEEMHQAKVGLVKEVQANLGDAIGAGRDVARSFKDKKKGKVPPGKGEPGEPGPEEISVDCAWCGVTNIVAIDTKAFNCSACNKVTEPEEE